MIIPFPSRVISRVGAYVKFGRYLISEKDESTVKKKEQGDERMRSQKHH